MPTAGESVVLKGNIAYSRDTQTTTAPVRDTNDRPSSTAPLRGANDRPSSTAPQRDTSLANYLRPFT